MNVKLKQEQVLWLTNIKEKLKMTDEEMAEEYACEHEYEYDDIGVAREALYQAYLDGLAEGKKENERLKKKTWLEEGSQWHDLRKDPNDLPDNGRLVLVMDKSRRKYDFACLCRSKNSGDFWCYERMTSEVKYNYVVAWCDFPRFEE